MGSEAGKRLIEGAKEILAIAKGEKPAARIHHGGHAYVPEADYATLQARVDELTRKEHLAKLDIALRNEAIRILETERSDMQAVVREAKDALKDARFAIETTVACLNTWNGGRGSPTNTDGIVRAIDAALARLSTLSDRPEGEEKP